MYFKRLNKNLQLYIASMVLNQTKTNLIVNGFIINEQMEAIAQDHLLNHKPLSKIFNTKAFWKNDFYTNEFTLDPRPETEALIELFLFHNHKNVTVLDVGVGTGAILLSLMLENSTINGIGIDISQQTLNVCEKNAKKFNLKPTLQCMSVENCNIKANILISNPPYLTAEEIHSSIELQYDPYIALYGGENGLKVYEQLLELAKRCKFEYIYLEVPPKRQQIVQHMFSDFNHVYIL